MLTGPGQTIGVSVFIDHLVDALGIGRSTVSTAYLLGTLTGAAAMPFFGRFLDRTGVRRAQVLVGIGFTLALVNMAGVTNALWLAIGFGGIRMMGQGALSMISTVSVAVWFERRRGLAMGVLATVGGAMLSLVPIVLNTVIDATSWRTAWLVAAAFVLVTVVPLGWFGLIDRPSDVGQHPDGLPPRSVDELAGASDRSGPVRSYDRGEAIRTTQFWILATVSTVTGMLITGLNFHQIDLLSDAGLTSTQAAAMFLPQILGTSATALAVGFLMDRMGIRWVPALGMVLLIGVHLLAANVGPGPSVFIYAVSLGATAGATRAALSTMLPGYFGTDHIGSIQGIMTLTGVAGSALGPVALAVAEERLGDYRSANLALMVIPVIALLFTLTNRPLPSRHA